MSDKEKKITKAEIYGIVGKVFSGEVALADVSEDMAKAVVDRMVKDIDQTKTSTSKKETANDKLNKEIQKVILDTLEGRKLVYADFVKEVQGKFADTELSAQKITANVKLIESLVKKELEGKGKEKKLYIWLA